MSEPIFVGLDDAIEVLRVAGLPMRRWRLYELVRDGHLPAGRVVLREGARKILFRVDGLRSWVATGGTLAPRPEPARAA